MNTFKLKVIDLKVFLSRGDLLNNGLMTINRNKDNTLSICEYPNKTMAIDTDRSEKILVIDIEQLLNTYSDYQLENNLEPEDMSYFDDIVNDFVDVAIQEQLYLFPDDIKEMVEE